MSNNETKPFVKLVVLLIAIMTVLSITVFAINGEASKKYKYYSETAEKFNHLYELADSDIQGLLQLDSTKYDLALAYLYDLFSLNNQYDMMEYYYTNFTQQDFDAIEVEFTATLRQMIETIQSTNIYLYSKNCLNATVSNNYTYAGFEFYLITNRFYDSSVAINSNILDFVNLSFFQLGIPVEMPEIKFDSWTDILYRNLSILTSFNSKAVNYISMHPDFNVNLTISIEELLGDADTYSFLSGRAEGIVQDFNNTLITLATSAVILGFATSFENKKYRKICVVIGLITLFLAIFYITFALTEFLSIEGYELSQIWL